MYRQRKVVRFKQIAAPVFHKKRFDKEFHNLRGMMSHLRKQYFGRIREYNGKSLKKKLELTTVRKLSSLASLCGRRNQGGGGRKSDARNM